MKIAVFNGPEGPIPTLGLSRERQQWLINKLFDFYSNDRVKLRKSAEFFAVYISLRSEKHKKLLGKSTYYRHRRLLIDAGVLIEKEVWA